MHMFRKLITGGEVAAFFFFSWVIMMLWNGIISHHLGLLPPLGYLQAAGLWFLTILLFAWTGIGAGHVRHAFHFNRVKDRDWSEIGDRVEQKIKRGFARWVGSAEDEDWDELGKKIEEKIKRKVREWTEED